MGIASSVVGRLNNAWKQPCLSLQTKLRIYTSCVQSTLLHGADKWTILKADGKWLLAFHMQCQRRILRIRWSDFVTNATVAEKTGLPNIRAVIGDRRLALFGHVRRLPKGTPAHHALQASVELSSGTNNITWRRKPGRPRNSLLRGVLKDIQLIA